MLNHRDKQFILNNFPYIELCREKSFHNKVPSSNFYLTIPKGKKYFTWFRRWKKWNVCIFLKLSNNKRHIDDIKIYNVCFDNRLCYKDGTIFYGTLFTIKKQMFYNVENIYYSLNKDITQYTQKDKWVEISKIFNKYLKQKSNMQNDVIFGTPIISEDHEKIKRKIQNLPYELYSIQHRLFRREISFFNESNQNLIIREANFFVKTTIRPDIYDLLIMDNGSIEKHNIAYIPDYKTSVFMNSLFRKIKENDNLDLLEESDDEEEFENISIDKFVNLSTTHIMKCVYNKKYKLWKPMKIVNENITTKQEILKMEI